MQIYAVKLLNSARRAVRADAGQIVSGMKNLWIAVPTKRSRRSAVRLRFPASFVPMW